MLTSEVHCSLKGYLESQGHDRTILDAIPSSFFRSFPTMKQAKRMTDKGQPTRPHVSWPFFILTSLFTLVWEDLKQTVIPKVDEKIAERISTAKSRVRWRTESEYNVYASKLRPTSKYIPSWRVLALHPRINVCTRFPFLNSSWDESS